MKVRGNHGQGRTERRGCGNTDLRDLVRTIVELAGACAESTRAGGDVWYELAVYVYRGGVQYQVQRHGSVVGGNSPPPALEARKEI